MLIAVVEDEKMMNQYIQNLLIKAGWSTESFFSAEEFLDRAKEKKYDCVIVDINLKLMTGFDIIYFLKKYFEKYGDIKTVILSSETQQESVNKGFYMGANDYIKKPFDDDEFIFRMRNILRVNNNFSKKQVYYKEALFDFEKSEAIFNGKNINLTLHYNGTCKLDTKKKSKFTGFFDII